MHMVFAQVSDTPKPRAKCRCRSTNARAQRTSVNINSYPETVQEIDQLILEYGGIQKAGMISFEGLQLTQLIWVTGCLAFRQPTISE